MKSLYVVGDSISIQYGPYLEQALAGHFSYARKEGVSEAMQDLDIPKGANGGDSSMVLPYLQGRFSDKQFRPDVFMLNCGLHDIKLDGEQLQVSIEDYQKNLQAIVDIIPSSTALVWVRSTPVVDEIHKSNVNGFQRRAADLEAYNSIADDIMDKGAALSIDLYGFTKTLGPDAYCDHVHFHDSVREQQANYIAALLIEQFAK